MYRERGEPEYRVHVGRIRDLGHKRERARDVCAARPRRTRPRPVGAAILGGQNTYVIVSSTNFFHNVSTDQISADVKVQNLTSVAMGSADGNTYDGTGVNVFFNSLPAAPVTWTTPPEHRHLPFDQRRSVFPIPAARSRNSSSALQSWVFGLHGLRGIFGFLVYVSAKLPTDPAMVVIPAHLFPSISSGYNQICAIRTGSIAYCWGNDSLGQLGDGRTMVAPVPVPAAAEHKYSALAAGLTHGCGIEQGTTSGCAGARILWVRSEMAAARSRFARRGRRTTEMARDLRGHQP